MDIAVSGPFLAYCCRCGMSLKQYSLFFFGKMKMLMCNSVIIILLLVRFFPTPFLRLLTDLGIHDDPDLCPKKKLRPIPTKGYGVGVRG